MASRGSEWAKWDLHVHSPASLVHNYPGPDPWAYFLDDLESLPGDIKVVGINDYLFLDGYRRVQEEKAKGRLANLDLLIPVVELRIPQFGGTNSHWSRVNLHVLFDPQLSAEQIEKYFLAALTRSYVLSPEAQVNGIVWNEFPERASLEALGNKIIQSVPESERGKYKSPLIEGFKNLNVQFSDVKRALDHTALRGKAMLAVGKTEWAGVKWADSSIAEKKTVINDVDFVFVSANTPGEAIEARSSLQKAGVNGRLLDCSDAHWLSGSQDKDRVGNCFTWIKAEKSFRGLRYAMLEYANRVYVGDQPPVVGRVRNAPGKFIDSVAICSREGSSPDRDWFNCEISLNPEMVCLVGHKGSGKSAFADIVALAGNSRNEEHFSFLRPDRFRRRPNPSKHFDVVMRWRDGLSNQVGLSSQVDRNEPERVRYLPQSYLEGICTEVSDGSEGRLERELKRIIFECTPESDRHEADSLDALIEEVQGGFKAPLEASRRDIKRINEELLQWEQYSLPEYKTRLATIKSKQQELLRAHHEAAPEAVDNPAESVVASADTQAEYRRLEEELVRSGDLELRIQLASNRLSELRRAQSALKRLRMRLLDVRSQLDGLAVDLRDDISKHKLQISIENTLSFRISLSDLDKEGERLLVDISAHENQLDVEAPGSLVKQLIEVRSAIESISARLSEPQRRYAQYQSNLAEWQARRAEIVGSETNENSLEWIAREESKVAAAEGEIARLTAERKRLVLGLATTMLEMNGSLAGLYQAAATALNVETGRDLPIEFQVSLQPGLFKERFLDFIHLGVRSSFQGQDSADSKVKELIAETSFSDAESIAEFVSRVLFEIRHVQRDGRAELIDVASVVKGGHSAPELYDFVAGLEYLRSSFELLFERKNISVLSPGQRGMVLLLFYLLVDPENIPLIVDQPEENLDNHTVVAYLTDAFRRARSRRQLIVVTHNANLAVVCDADQVIHCYRGEEEQFLYAPNPLESLKSIDPVVEILEGTRAAFEQRGHKYRR